MAQRRLKPLPKFLIILAIVLGLGWLIWSYAPSVSYGGDVPSGIFKAAGSGGDYDPDAGNPNARKLENPGDPLGRPIRVGVVTWGGYAGGQYFNRGFRPNPDSMYKKEFGIEVEFVVNDDFDASRAAWKNGDVDFLWTTIDAFPTESAGLAPYKPKVVFQADWSRGGDVIVVRPGIDTVSNLRGKKIAFAQGTPSHTFLLWLLDSGGMSQKDVTLVPVSDAIKAAETFKTGSVDAAVVWSPDDDACVEAVPGSKRLVSTKQASHIIADVFFAKEEFLRQYPAETQALVAGWMIGAAEINSSDSAKQEAVDILTEGLQMPRDFCENAINNVRLTTYGDNVNFFGRTGNTGEDLYRRMTEVYASVGLARNAPPWRVISDVTFIRSINLTGDRHYAESLEFEAPTQDEIDNPTIIASKPVTINFATGSASISGAAQTIILKEVVPMIRGAGKARIRIEGNTDNTGSRATNVALSQKRAESVRDYLVQNYEFDADKFIVVGNGPDKPLLTNATAVGRAANRRTDIVVQQ